MSGKKHAKGKSRKKLDGRDTGKMEMAENADEVNTADPDDDFRDNYLFLLEFFVDGITGDRLCKLNEMFFVPTSVAIEFLDFRGAEAVEIKPTDPLFSPRAGVVDQFENFHAGRSVLFALEQNAVLDKSLEFVMKITVQKRMPEGIQPDVLVGEAGVDLSKQFAALRMEMLQCWQRNVPISKSFEGRLALSFNDAVAGAIRIFVRMSAFGQTIVTEFDAPPAEKTSSSYIFRGDEMNQKSLTYKCRLIDSDNIDVCKESRENVVGCPVCMKEAHLCLPCGQPAGAMDRSEVAVSSQETCRRAASRNEICEELDPAVPDGIDRRAIPCGKAVVLKVSGLINNGDRKPTVTVASAADACGAQSADPEHDVFILRIGKKGLVGAGEKSDIQLEMRTPKGPERRPPIRYETREMQTDPDSKPKKEKKGKKGKK